MPKVFSSLRARLFAGACALSLCVTATSVATAEAAGLEDRRDFSIAAQALDVALVTFSRQADVQVITASAHLKHLQTKGVSGAKTVGEALKELLSGTGLSFRVVGESTVAIESSSRAQAAPQAPAGGEAQSSQDDKAKGGDKPTTKDRVEKVTVTGTRIRGIKDGPSPVTVYDKEDIEKTGAGTFSEFMRTLPENFSGALDEQVTSGLAIDAANVAKGTTVNLRGLGSAGTLILLNGRRLPSSTNSDFVDISSIPVGAIERIEVLTDGASAIYGSDAIGGVVNIVLRRDYDGAETAARIAGGGVDQRGFTQTLGHNWASGRALVVYDYFEQSSLYGGERDYTRLSTVGALIPRQRRHSVVVSAEQDIAEGLRIGGDLFYSSKDVDSRSITGSLTGPAANILDNKVWSATLGAAVALGGDWELDVNGAYGFNDLFRLTFPTSQPAIFQNEIMSAEVKADGTLFSLPGGDVRAALGASHLRQDFLTVQTNALFNRDLGRDISAAFAELYIPIIGRDNTLTFAKRLEVSIAARTEHYSDVGDTTNPKFGIVWAPTDALTLRSTWGTSFRAPDFFENSLLDSVQLRSNFPDPGSPTGLSTVLILNGSENPLGPLRPETADVFTAGIEYRDQEAKFRTSLNYFDIAYTDRIAAPGLAAAMLANPALYGQFIIRNPSQAVFDQFIASATLFDNRTGLNPPPLANVIVNSRLLNLSSQDLSGLDFAVSYATDIDDDLELRLGLDSTYLLQRDDVILPGGPTVDQLNNVYAPVDLTARASVGLGSEEWDATVFLNYKDSYENRFFTPVREVEAWFSVDLSMIYRPSWLAGSTAIFSVQNLTDEEVPFVVSPSFDNVNYDGTNASAMGRLVSFQLKYSW